MQSKYPIYLVGGYVRDKLMNLPSKDMDYSVEAPSFEKMQKEIIRLGGEIFLESPEYFTIRARLNGDVSDFVLCRKEGKYSDGRRPDKVEVGTIFDDLSRRDFTMNAIAIRMSDGEYIDPHNGKKDIENKLIRCVGDTQDRMREDYLRGLRALRFSITKNMQIDDEIVDFLLDYDFVEGIESVSEERIREELYKMFRHNTRQTLATIYHFELNYLFDGRMWLCPTLKEK